MMRLFGMLRTALGLLLLAMVLLNVANAAGRYLFGKAIPGSDELLVFAMVWLVFLGACLVSLEGRHLGLDLLPRALGARGRRWLQVAIALVTALLTGFVALQSWAVLEKLLAVGQKSMATEIPMAIPHAAVPISFALICLISLYFVFRPGRGSGEGGDAGDSAKPASDLP